MSGWPESQVRLLALLLLSLLSAESATGLDLGSAPPYRDLAPHIQYLTDTQGALDVNAVVAATDKFQEVEGELVDFGFSSATHWLRLPLSNSGTSSAGGSSWILSFNMRFMQELQVYALREGELTLLLDNGRSSVFAERLLPYRHLALPFELTTDESVVLYIRYFSEGTTALPLSIESEASFAELRNLHLVKNVVFYSFTAFMLIYSLMFFVVLRRPLFRNYALYLGSVALYILHMDGYTLQYLWPGQPEWNSYAALPLGLLLNVAAAHFSRSFLQTRDRHPRLDTLLVAIMVLALAMIVLSAWLDVALLKRLSFVYTFLCAVAFLGCGLFAYRRKTIGVRFYIAGWAGMTGAALYTNVAHLSAGMLAVGMSFELIRLGLLFDATMMALAILEQHAQIRRAHDRAADEAKALADAQLGLQNRLTELEHGYETAFALAAERGVQLASASHDLRQPLGAMRMALRDLSANPAQQELITSSLGYLESLVERYLSAAADPAASLPGNSSNSSTLGLRERFPLSLVQNNLNLMFAAKAAKHGCRLRIVASSVEVESDPLVLVRIASNLVDNAIKHANAQRIVVGARRRAGNVELWVIDDGVGMERVAVTGAAAELTAQAAHHNGDEAGPNRINYGLGLGIVRDLAREQGLPISVRSGAGTAVSVTLPRAKPVPSAKPV